MRTKLYRLVLLCIVFYSTTLRAQTADTCNAWFQYYYSGNSVIFVPLDSNASIQEWDFGDSSSSIVHVGPGSLPLVTHVYHHSSAWTVTHTVRDTLRGCTSSVTQQVISPSDSCSVNIGYFTDAFSDTSRQGYYYFNANTSVPSYFISSYTWSVDGVTQSVSSNNLFGYGFQQTGNHQVCVQLQSNYGCNASQCIQVQVQNIDSCSASFTYAASPDNPLLFSFTPVPNNPNYNYSWRIDSTTTTDRQPTYQFKRKGTYEVNLSITKRDSSGAACTAKTMITVQAGYGPADTCSLNLTYNINPNKPNQVSFIAQSGQRLISQEWTILRVLDSSVVTLQNNNPVYNFTDSGFYFISLKAVTQAGCTAYAYGQLYIDSVMNNPAHTNDSSIVNSYPNPASNQINLNINLTTSKNITINVFSLSGNMVATKQVSGFAGSNIISIPVQNLQSGMYYVEIKYGNETRRSRFQKL